MKIITFNSIGLDTISTKYLAKDLNDLLANYQGYCKNLRGIYCNIKGKRFFDLHVNTCALPIVIGID